jgi:hypothetical protein
MIMHENRQVHPARVGLATWPLDGGGSGSNHQFWINQITLNQIGNNTCGNDKIELICVPITDC